MVMFVTMKMIVTSLADEYFETLKEKTEPGTLIARHEFSHEDIGFKKPLL